MIGACCGSPNESFFGPDDDDEYDDDLTKYDPEVARTGDESCSLEGGIISTTSDSSSGSSNSSSGGGARGGDDDTASNSCRKDANDVVTTSNKESPDILQTTYSRKTPLFRAIEKQEWESILTFLRTGKWSQYHGLFLHPHDAAVSTSNNNNTASTPLIQSKTWVRDGSLNQLPLHLAICKGAPAIVVQHLLDQYPEAVKCCDSEKMLPLHLAFANGASDAVLYALLRAWPQSFRISPAPYECASGDLGGHGGGGGGGSNSRAGGANKSSTPTSSSSLRNEIIRIAVQETQAAVQQKHQDAWKAVIANSGMGADELLDTTDLSTLLSQLLADRKQLQEMKTMLKGQFSSSSSYLQQQQRKGATNPVVSSVSNMTTATPTTTIATIPPPSYAPSGSLQSGVYDDNTTTPDSSTPDATTTDVVSSKTKKSSRSSWGRRFGFGGKSS